MIEILSDSMGMNYTLYIDSLPAVFHYNKLHPQGYCSVFADLVCWL